MRPTLEDLFEAILLARSRVYRLASSTPLQRLEYVEDAAVFVKREDLSPINSYKWRGAYNRMQLLTREELVRGVVCASAGNHAQGVALAALELGTRADIFMPRSTPYMKQEAVRRLGGDAARVTLVGDSYDDASKAAMALREKSGKVYIHPYDDLAVMAGQGTIGDEIVMSGEGPFDVAYLQIGGGGMAAGVACWLKRYYPQIEIVGVEGVDQASMQAAVKAGAPVTLDYVDVFCDGSAVKRAGELTSHFCAQLVDRFLTVTNEEVCAAIQMLWESKRAIPEPAGAMGLAGWLKERSRAEGKRVLTIVCGANMDFGQLSWVVRHAGIGSARRKFYRFVLEERPGTLLHLLETFLDSVNIVEFQHGIKAGPVATPVIGIDAMPSDIDKLEKRLSDLGVSYADATGDEDVEFRIIRYDASLFRKPCFIKIEFPERPGALLEFLRDQCSAASIVYFSYNYTGERVGRALIGFDFPDRLSLEAFKVGLAAEDSVLRAVVEVPLEVVERIAG